MIMKTTRRSAIAAFGATAIGATLSAPSVLSQEKIEWRMITSWPKNLPGPGVTAQRLADRINTLSGGRLSIRLYAAGELVPALEVLNSVASGVAQIGHTAPLFWAGRMPAAPLFTAGPFGLTPLEHITWIDHGGGQALWDELYAPQGVKPFMAGNTGFQMGGWFRKEINSLADIKGLKMRMPGLGGLVLARLGGTAVTVAPPEIFTSLQTGVIDATEFLGPFSDMAMGFQKAAKFYYTPGWHEPNGTGEAIVSLEAWNALPDDLKAIVETACRAENIFSLGEAEWLNAEALKRLQSDFGVEVRNFPTDFLDAARAATRDVMDELAARDELTGRIVESYRQAAFHQAQWSEISLTAFLSARNPA
ncbi:MAG: TRAP transporter substrate-binding protein [Nitratireductor sp.]|nr:TRAP transporter substrate-binding protein [Nitratireductor sp.]